MDYKRLKELAGIIEEKKENKKATFFNTKKAMDGQTYGIIKEGNKFYTVIVEGETYKHIGNEYDAIAKRGKVEIKKAVIFLEQKVKEINDTISYNKNRILSESYHFGEAEDVDGMDADTEDNADMGDDMGVEPEVPSEDEEMVSADEIAPEGESEETPDIGGGEDMGDDEDIVGSAEREMEDEASVDSETDMGDEGGEEEVDGSEEEVDGGGESPQVIAGKIQHMLRKMTGESGDISAAVNQVIGAVAELAKDTEYQDETQQALKKKSIELSNVEESTISNLKDSRETRKAKLESLSEAKLQKIIKDKKLLEGKGSPKINMLLKKLKIVESKRQKVLLKK